MRWHVLASGALLRSAVALSLAIAWCGPALAQATPLAASTPDAILKALHSGPDASGAQTPPLEDHTISSDTSQLFLNPTLITLNLSSVDIRQVLQLLAKQGGMNLVLDDSVQGRVSVNFTAVPLSDALNYILRMHDLEMERMGATLLVATREVFDKRHYGGSTTVVLHLDNSTADKILPTIKEALVDKSNQNSVKLMSDARTNSIIITAPQSFITKAKALIQALDVPSPQVLIDVKMIEVSQTGQQQMGLHYGFGGSKFGASWDNPTPDTLAGGTGNQAGNPATGTGGTSITFSALGNVTANFNARLDWAIQNNYATVLADPEVAAQDNTKATIALVNKHPIINTSVDSYGHANSTVTFVDVGQTLSITPRIDTKGNITLALQPEISADSGDVIVNGNPVPVINSRSVTTTMRVKDGESIVIGGLERSDVTNSVEKMPILGDIPILGRLFQTTTQSTDKSEILIEVTPHITTRLVPSQVDLSGLNHP